MTTNSAYQKFNYACWALSKAFNITGKLSLAAVFMLNTFYTFRQKASYSANNRNCSLAPGLWNCEPSKPALETDPFEIFIIQLGAIAFYRAGREIVELFYENRPDTEENSSPSLR